MNIPKWLIAAALLLFVTLIATVAFLVGRETARPATVASTAAAATASQEPAAATGAAPDTDTQTLPLPAPLGALTSPSNETPASSAKASFDAAPATASSPVTVADHSSGAVEARGRVATYFRQMDAIQLGAPIGDQQAFATTILGAAVSGDLSGFDDLVRQAGDAERRALAVQPPSECAEYHQLAVTLLRDSASMVAALRDGIKRGDADALTAVGAAAQRLQPRAEALAETEKALRARFGL